MENLDRFETPLHAAADESELLELGLWMRAAFAGALAATGGVAALVDPAWVVSTSSALVAIGTGAGLAGFAWRRAQAILRRADARIPTLIARAPAPAAKVPAVLVRPTANAVAAA